MRNRRTTAGRGPRTDLSTERVRAEALRILDSEGTEALSMRRLAQALDREAMTLYRYAANKAALLDGVVELVLDDLNLDPAAPDWAAELTALATKFEALVLAHPHVLPLLVTLPRRTPLGMRPAGTVRLLEDFVELLTRAGFSAGDALHGYRLFFGFLHGHALGQLQEGVQNPALAADQLRLTLHQLPRDQFPHLHELAGELSAYDGPAELRVGLALVLTALGSLLPADPPAEPR